MQRHGCDVAAGALERVRIPLQRRPVRLLDGAPHADPAEDCTTVHEMGLWLLVECVVQLCNVAMACYLVARFGRPYDRSKPHDRNFARRFTHLVVRGERPAVPRRTAPYAPCASSSTP